VKDAAELAGSAPTRIRFREKRRETLPSQEHNCFFHVEPRESELAAGSFRHEVTEIAIGTDGASQFGEIDGALAVKQRERGG